MSRQKNINLINYETQTATACKGLSDLDQTFIGTPDYMGLAWFWDCDYKYYLRDSSFSNRALVHRKLLESGLEVSGRSPQHAQIVQRWARPVGRKG